MFLNSLTGRFLLLTIVFVMLAEVMIFVPSVARFRQDYLQARLERGQLASLAVLANADQMVNPALKKELLENAGVMNVVLRRNEVRELVLSSPMPVAVEATYDLRDASPIVLIRDAVMILFDADDRVIRVIGTPVKKAGLQIEVTLHTTEMRTAMLDYGYSVFLLSLIISVITSALLFFAVRWFLVLPIRRVVGHITAFKDAPQDLAKIIEPSAGITELFQAEQALMAMQIELSKALKQKDRLAILGGAVAKISHDLRNMLTTAQLLADRMEMSKDPAVRRTTPKLVSSLSRAIKLCESTLKFGKAEEPSPVLVDFPLQPLVEDVVESESLPIEGDTISYALAIPDGMRVRADAEQIFRVLSNLIRNAQQAVVATKKPGTISVTATVDANFWSIEVRDTGPGLPTRAQAHLFEAFEGGARQGGSGLGLAIASELVRGHGGTLELVETNENGTCFRICLHIGKGPDLLPEL